MVGTRGAGDLDCAWDAAIAGWVRASLGPETTALRAELDRVVPTRSSLNVPGRVRRANSRTRSRRCVRNGRRSSRPGSNSLRLSPQGFASRQLSAMPTSTVRGTLSDHRVLHPFAHDDGGGLGFFLEATRRAARHAPSGSCVWRSRAAAVQRGDRASPSSGCPPPSPESACSRLLVRPARASENCGWSGWAPAAAARPSF